MTSAPKNGHAELPAVRVAGQDQRVAEGVPAVEHAQVGRVGDADREVGRGVGRLVVETVVLEVRVVDADEGEPAPGDLERGVPVGQVGPAPLR